MHIIQSWTVCLVHPPGHPPFLKLKKQNRDLRRAGNPSVASMSSGEDNDPADPGRAPELQVTTKEHQFGLRAPVSETGKNQNTLQLEQEGRT